MPSSFIPSQPSGGMPGGSPQIYQSFVEYLKQQYDQHMLKDFVSMFTDFVSYQNGTLHHALRNHDDDVFIEETIEGMHYFMSIRPQLQKTSILNMLKDIDSKLDRNKDSEIRGQTGGTILPRMTEKISHEMMYSYKGNEKAFKEQTEYALTRKMCDYLIEEGFFEFKENVSNYGYHNEIQIRFKEERFYDQQKPQERREIRYDRGEPQKAKNPYTNYRGTSPRYGEALPEDHFRREDLGNTKSEPEKRADEGFPLMPKDL